MTERCTRPTVQSIKEAYDRVFKSGITLTRLKDAVLGGRFFPASEDTLGLSGRSISWKLFLTQDEPLENQPPPYPPLVSLRSSRKIYTDMLLENMRAPDGSYEDNFTIPGSMAHLKKPENSPGNLEKNNPLSLHDENPWTDWFASVELRKTIMQDVERTFPDIGYFREADVQSQLMNILFLYSVTHPAVGYRQGMHELLAPLYYAIDYDSILDDENTLPEDSAFREMCSRTWVAADAWALFTVVMRSASKWYEWREWRETDKSTAATTSASLFATHFQLNVPDGAVDLKPYVAPIVQVCERIQSQLLKSVDPSLWRQMQGAGIEPQIYGIRWLRLLFTREFNMADAMILWDGLFACDPTFELAPWICVAMLIRIRNRLMPSDYSSQLMHLLHYPSPPTSVDLEVLPHHGILLLRQALALQMSPTPGTGASIVMENRNLLNIPIEVPDSLPAPLRRGARPGDRPLRSEGRSGAEANGVKAVHLRQQSSPQMGLPEMLARGLLDRGESLGINKTLMTAVSELRRNLPDLAASLVRTPSTSTASYAAFPLVDERPPEERPPWEPRSRFEMEGDISQMRIRNKLLGKSLNWIVDVLLQDEDAIEGAGQLKTFRARKREALESLSYIRDVLNGDLMDIDGERLVGEEDMKAKTLSEQQDRKGLEGASVERFDTPQLRGPSVVAPVPVPVVEPRRRPSPANSDQIGFHSSPVVGPRLPPKPSLKASPPSSGSLRAPAGSLSPSPSLLTPGSAPLAPWNYTRSSFSNTVPPTATLPRLPPPTSTTFRPHHRPTSSSERGSQPTSSSSAKPGQSPQPPGSVQHDPLGVLP